MAKASHTYEQCLEQAKRYEAMGFPLQANVWRSQAEKVKQEEGEKRLRVWKRRMESRLGSVGLTEWLEWAFTQYSVREIEDGMYKVMSACSDKEWVVDYEADALEKVAQLVGWKEYDRSRGRGNMVEDVNGKPA